MNVKMFLYKNNKGSTLIEVIVSVLIVGIAFVPLLMGMTNALKANTRAEQILHAETVASNCIEVAKTFGMKDFEKVKDDAEILAASSVTGSGTSYTASSINEGLDTFNVDISFSCYNEGTTELKPQNMQKYMNFNNIRGAYTVTHTKLADDTRLSSYKAISGSKPDTIPIPDTTEIRDLVRRKQTVLTIGRYGSSDTNANAWHIDSTVSYLIVNSDGTHGYFEKDGDYKAFVETTPTVQLCGTENADCPSTIILFYSALPSNIANLNAAGGANKEYIIIDNQTGTDVNVFVFVSGATVNFDDPSLPSAANMYFGVLNSTGSDTNVFCTCDPVSYTGIYTSAGDQNLIDTLWEDTKFETSHPTSFSTSNKIPTVSDVEGALSLVAKQSGKMIYDVIVTVSDTNGNVMANKKATIIE